jgi:MerR family transcriptional regulator, copper efflux regulator
MSTDAAAAGNGSPVAGLVPIDAVARRFGIPASTIRYYEERGLVQPVSRRAGRRWYGQDEIRQLAIIRFWQKSGQMSLDEIGEILGGPDASAAWQHIIRERIEAITAQIDSMLATRDYLEHILGHHQHSPPDGCEYFEKVIWSTGTSTEARH